jgi:hypothetical protein
MFIQLDKDFYLDITKVVTIELLEHGSKLTLETGVTIELNDTLTSTLVFYLSKNTPTGTVN